MPLGDAGYLPTSNGARTAVPSLAPNEASATPLPHHRAKGPEEWRPPDEGYRCRYATDWTEVKMEWELTMTQREAEAIIEMLDTCEEPIEVKAESAEGISGRGMPGRNGPVVRCIHWHLRRGTRRLRHRSTCTAEQCPTAPVDGLEVLIGSRSTPTTWRTRTT